MAQTATPTVLVIDDEPNLRELLGDLLSSEGWSVRTAGDASEAIASACQTRPDLVVADVNLPDATGFDVVRRLRDRVGNIPAVMITGLGDIATAAEATRCGCVDFLTKPIDAVRLRASARRGLKLSEHGDRLARHDRRLMTLARQLNRDRHELRERINDTGASLTRAYAALARQLKRQEAVMRFQQHLLTCQDDDDIFRGLFRHFASRGPKVFGLAMVCDASAELEMTGRFGIPAPDSLDLCEHIGRAMTDPLLSDPRALYLAPGKHLDLLGEQLADVASDWSFLCVPLLPEPGQLIGILVLYRKAGRAFDEEEIRLAGLLGAPIALAIRRAGLQSEN